MFNEDFDVTMSCHARLNRSTPCDKYHVQTGNWIPFNPVHGVTMIISRNGNGHMTEDVFNVNIVEK